MLKGFFIMALALFASMNASAESVCIFGAPIAGDPTAAEICRPLTKMCRATLPGMTEQDCIIRLYDDEAFHGRMATLVANAEARVQDAIRRKQALPGVSIGMTPKTVREKTHWGTPESINRTTTRYGVQEQWVYGGGNYLYFDNGRLTAIQN